MRRTLESMDLGRGGCLGLAVPGTRGGERPATAREAELEAEVSRLRRALAAFERAGSRSVAAERRQAAAVAASEARLRSAYATAEVGVFERDLLTGRAHWSPTMFRLYGLNPAGRDPMLRVCTRINPLLRLGLCHEPA
jgi:PAS domain-containing protein